MNGASSNQVVAEPLSRPTPLPVAPPIPSKVVIVGVPRAGKTTLAVRVGAEHSRRVRHTDELIGKLAWGKDSEEVARWLDAPGDWVIEGVTAVRALRKWMALNPSGRLDGVLVINLPCPMILLTAGQSSAAKGVRTIWVGIEKELRERGADVRNLGGRS
jgi:adenylate kinase family enzyme